MAEETNKTEEVKEPASTASTQGGEIKKRAVRRRGARVRRERRGRVRHDEAHAGHVPPAHGRERVA